MHKTEHISRYESMTEHEFMEHVKYYKRFKHISQYDHTLNIDYINDRLKKHNLYISEGCCNKFYILEHDIQK